jgi:hypothetical protein
VLRLRASGATLSMTKPCPDCAHYRTMLTAIAGVIDAAVLRPAG